MHGDENPIDCYAGYRGEEEPVALSLGERRLEVTESMNRWLAPTHRYFKLAALVGSAIDPHRIGKTLH